jgi:hypothetical protein
MSDFAFPQAFVCGLGRSYPQRPPHFAVRPRAQDEGSEHSEPILAVSGVGKEPCCASCASGGPCTGCGSEGVAMPPCSTPKATPSIPGSTSFPVGFGQSSSAPVTTTSVPVAMVTAWAVPLVIGAISIAAGFGLAYAINHR